METLSRARAIDSIRFPSSGCRLLRQSYFAFLLVIAGILVCVAAPGSSVYGATPASGPAASAASIIGTEAKLNGTPLTPGATLFPGDVMHHPIQVFKPAWNAVFDAQADLARQSRAWALNFAVAKNARVFSSHFPDSSTGYIRAAHNGYEWKAQD